MTGSREASYANFRFYSEALLGPRQGRASRVIRHKAHFPPSPLLAADVLPRGAEQLFLDAHNSLGGRLGGASRFEVLSWAQER